MPDMLGEMLDAELGAGLSEFDPDVPDAPGLDVPTFVVPGLSRTESLSELAELLSGSSDKKSRAYKSARRQAERWSPSERMRARGIKARTPTPKSRTRLRRARRAQDDRLRRFRLHGGQMRVKVSWYDSRTPEWLPPHRWVHIRQLQMRQVVRLWASGDPDSATNVLFAEFLKQYEVPNPTDWLRDVVVLDLRLRPAGDE